MSSKTYVLEGEQSKTSHIGATLETLAATIAKRRTSGEESYSHRLLTGSVDDVLKKIMEEAGEVALAAKDVESWATSSLAAALVLQGDTCGEPYLSADAEKNSNKGASPDDDANTDDVAAGDGIVAAASEGARANGALVDEDHAAETLAVALPVEYHQAIDHLRYEAADVVYHLLVMLERYGISLDEFAAELNERMTDAERPAGAIRLRKENVQRGK